VICVVLQNVMGFVEGETGSYSETFVTCDVDGTEKVSIKVEDTIYMKEEVSIKVEETIDIKDEIPEATTFSSFKTEHEVRLCGVCEVVAAHAFRPFIAPKKKIVKLHVTISCFVLYYVCHIPLEIWNAILKRRDFLEVIVINGRIILKSILKKEFWNMWMVFL